MTWTPAQETQLRELAESGMSSSKIGVELHYSRNAIIGKMRRMGLKSSYKPIQLGRKNDFFVERRINRRGAVERRRAQKIVETAKSRALATIWQDPDAKLELTELPVMRPAECRCSLMQLTDDTCRFPSEDVGSEMFFCGEQSVLGLPYCAMHARMAYRPTSQRGFRPYHPRF
jgi:GcrA cell cycle regulator